jgi:uncharacterized membrane protein YkoI
MKNLKIAALLLVATTTVSAQDLRMDEVPANLQSAFSKTYSTAKDVEWEKNGDHYNVEFEVNRMDHDIWYDGEGNVMKSKMEIPKNQLPTKIASAVKTKYADYKIDSVEVYEQAGTKIYKVDIEKGLFIERKLTIDALGQIVSDFED